MSQRLAILILLASALASAQSPPSWIQLTSGPGLPGACQPGTAFFNTSAPVSKAFFVCDDGGNWSQQDPRASRVFIVQNFGAKGDGIADDFRALSDAAQAASSAGGIVFLPPGTYLHSDMVDFGSNTLVQGTGDSSVLTGTHDNFSALHFPGAANCGITLLRTISHAKQRLGSSTSAAILFEGSQSCFVRNVSVEGSASVGIMVRGSTGIAVDGNRVKNTQADGIHVVDGSAHVTVTGNRGFNTGDDSFSAVAYANLPQTADVVIDSNVSISSHARGVACIGAAGCTITNNKVYNSQAHGIAVAFETSFNTWRPSGATIQHNVIRGVTSPAMNALLISFADSVQISDVQIYDSTPVYCHGSTKVQLNGVRIYNALGTAFLGLNCSQLQLDNVQVGGAQGQGLNLQGIQGGSLNNIALVNLFTGGNSGAGAIVIDQSSNVTGSANTVSPSVSSGQLLQILNSVGTTVQVHGASQSSPQQPAIQSHGVLGAALSAPSVETISDNAMMTAFGGGLSTAADARSAGDADVVNSFLPQSLANSCVEIGGSRAYLQYVSADQINFIAPVLRPFDRVSVEVITNCGLSNEIRSNLALLPVSSASPQFFFWRNNDGGVSPVSAVDASTGSPLGDSSTNGSQPAHPGEVISIFLAGMGATSGILQPGLVGAPASALGISVTVSLDGNKLPASNVLFCGSTVYAGLYQLNLRLPKTLPAGNLPIQIQVGPAATPAGAYLQVSAK